MFLISGTSEIPISSFHNPLHQLPVPTYQTPPHTLELLNRVPLSADYLKSISKRFHCEWHLYQDGVRFPNPRHSFPRFLVNDDLSGLDSHVPDGVVPVANAQQGIPEPLDQPQCSVFAGLQVLMRLHILQHGHAPKNAKGRYDQLSPTETAFIPCDSKGQASCIPPEHH